MYPSTTVDWLEKLISFDTTSRNSNIELILFLKSYFEKHGVSSIVSYDPTKSKANLFATLPGESGNSRGGIIFSGHTDVVPCDGQKWDTNPFKAVKKDGRIYGRGSCDMKGFIAVCLSLTPTLLKMPRKKPVHFAWTYDEEVGCLGGRVMTELIKTLGISAEGCVVGEPTSNKVVVAHKGICVWEVCVTGAAVHSSYALTENGCNAVDYAARLIVKIRELSEDLKMNGVRDVFFDVPFTTMSTNMVNGGNAINTVPSMCKFTYEFRNLPSVLQESIQRRVEAYIDEELLPDMRQEYKNAKIELHNVARVPHMPDADETDPFVILMRQLAKHREVDKLGGATEAGQFVEIGVPVVVCGPGDIQVAHTPNEYVPISDLEKTEKILLSLIERNQMTKSRI